MKRPVVGVIGNRHIVENRFAVQMTGERNLASVAQVTGALPLIFAGEPTITDIGDLLSAVDGIVLTGARANVHPSRFDTEPDKKHEPYDEDRDAVALPLVEACVAQGVPIFGICRGFQEVNVAMGGTLHPEIRELPGRMNHRMPPDAPLAYADVVWPTDTGRHPWWPGRHWRSGGTLMVQRPGEAYSVWHQWASLDRSFLGWYVNLQEPLRRTPIGVDTQDHELDVVVAPDGTWQVKDAALVARRVEEGRITEATGAAIHQLGDEVVATLARGDAWWGRRWVDWRPDPAWTAPANVRDDWERVPWVDGRTVSA